MAFRGFGRWQKLQEKAVLRSTVAVAGAWLWFAAAAGSTLPDRCSLRKPTVRAGDDPRENTASPDSWWRSNAH